MTPIEKEITDKFQKGDVSAMDLLYDNYGDTLYGIVFQMVKNEEQAQDILQDAMVKVWRNSKSYDSGKGRLFTWLVSIVRNQAIDSLRKLKRSGQIYGQASDVVMEITEADNKDVSLDYDIKKVLGQLSEHHKSLIEHSYILGYTHPEIAEKFEIPIGTVKTRIRNAMTELRSIFGNGHS